MVGTRNSDRHEGLFCVSGHTQPGEGNVIWREYRFYPQILFLTCRSLDCCVVAEGVDHVPQIDHVPQVDHVPQTEKETDRVRHRHRQTETDIVDLEPIVNLEITQLVTVQMNITGVTLIISLPRPNS